VTRVNLTAKYPPGENESAAAYTDRLLTLARQHGTFRQCSIGYHEECSDQFGESCNCSCHALGIELTRDQLEAWAGRELTDEEVEALDIALPTSTVPAVIAALAEGLSS
jgi:hypothetical protein